MNLAMQAETPVHLTLREAAELYDVTVKTLGQHLRCGQLVGYKSRGAAGREWRVTRDALDEAGYRPRVEAGEVSVPEADELARLRQELAAARRAATAERRRADDLDRRLCHALLECGRLRTAVAGLEKPVEPDLDAKTTDWLMTAIAGGAILQPSGRPLLGDRAAEQRRDTYDGTGLLRLRRHL